MTDLLESLKKSELLCSNDALNDFNEFEVELSTKAILCDELLSVYKRRAVHLEKYESEHPNN